MGKVLSVLLGVIWMFGAVEAPAHAGPAAFQMSAVPEGSSWFCFTWRDRFNARDRAATCARTEERCEARRASIVSDSNEYTTLVSGCREQAKAAVVTYFDVMEDDWGAWALPSSQECASTRVFLGRDRDKRNLSACRLVGAVVPPPAPFQPEALEAGDAWFCARRASDLRACQRTRRGCEDMVVPDVGADDTVSDGADDRCAARPQLVASAFTARGLDGVLTGLAFATPSACAAVHHRIVDLMWTEVSACKPVGTTATPPLDRARLAGASGWSCYTLDGADGQRGSCSRSADVCVGALGLAGTDEQVAQGCARMAAAHAHERSGALFAFPTRALCLESARVSAGASRCEVVP